MSNLVVLFILSPAKKPSGLNVFEISDIQEEKIGLRPFAVSPRSNIAAAWMLPASPATPARL
jgi:hypothetical protein